MLSLNRVFCCGSGLLVSGSWFVVVEPSGFSGLGGGGLGCAKLLKTIGDLYGFC
jgi:hypothetical protein